MNAESQHIHRLQQLVEKSGKMIVFSGAGISTESGIPDFRSPGGLWKKYQPIDFADFLTSENARRETWRRKFAMSAVMDNARPNRGHHAVAKLVERGRVTAVITQNIDGLHQAAGVPEDRVIELHGNSTYAKCLECGKRYELAEIRRRFEPEEEPPFCDCGGFIKPATISFGQPMPVDELRRAEQAALACDLCLALGSSLVVYPAATIPALAKRNGARLIILNREPTDLDDVADLAFHAEIGETLAQLVGGL